MQGDESCARLPSSSDEWKGAVSDGKVDATKAMAFFSNNIKSGAAGYGCEFYCPRSRLLRCNDSCIVRSMNCNDHRLMQEHTQ